jgi:alpha-L-rhamnosidase
MGLFRNLFLPTLLLYGACCAAGVCAQTAHVSSERINPELLYKPWSARWIAPPGALPGGYGVYHFRRAFELASAPASFVVHVTGDNRYQLFVNGQRVTEGPARGDLAHWRYETVDLARLLRPGKNVLAAVVWNFGGYAPEAQISNRTGFLLEGDTEAERIVDTSPDWKCVRDEAYQPLPVGGEVNDYYVAGPGERVSAASYPWGWERPDFDDSRWQQASAGERGTPHDVWDNRTRAAWDLGNTSWLLVPRSIPLMEETPVRFARVRQSSGAVVPASFPAARAPFQIPAHAKARLLLDQNYLTTAYPELTVSGGSGANVTLRYAEALWLPGKHEKGDRDEVEGREFRGTRDLFVADGGARRTFRPLWWRTYRFVELTVETTDEPLTVEDLRGVQTSYPFVRRARFDADSEELQRILDVGWRTARACAHETYMDCPFYEQLQYAGDTRVQALVSFYMTGDGRLARNAIESLDESRNSEGMTFSRYPTRTPQFIAPFSLWWVGMLHDYWMYTDDPAFVRRMLPGVRGVLAFFAARQQGDGRLGRVPWWNFVDWTKEWPAGVPPAEDDGASAPLDLQLLLAYGWAAEMEDALGSKTQAAQYRQQETTLRAAVRGLYWDSARQLFADTPRKERFSQQTNALAILAGVTEGEEARAVMRRTLADPTLTQASVYFHYYLNAALNKSGEGDRYLEQLGPWRWMLGQGLTTWSEIADPATRSDCHAWGASPNFELFRTVLGVDSSAPGFTRVRIRPFLGRLTHVSGAIPHPKGEVGVKLVRVGGKLSAEISLPEGVTGEFIWRGVRRPLPPGRSKFML